MTAGYSTNPITTRTWVAVALGVALVAAVLRLLKEKAS